MSPACAEVAKNIRDVVLGETLEPGRSQCWKERSGEVCDPPLIGFHGTLDLRQQANALIEAQESFTMWRRRIRSKRAQNSGLLNPLFPKIIVTGFW